MQEGFQNFNQQNFDPNSLANQTSTVIMFCVISDNSISVQSYSTAMNTAARDVFIQELKNCHRKSDIVVKNIVFGSDVQHKSGFLPILNVPDDYFDIDPVGRSTSLYQAVLEGLEHSMKYRADLEDQGIEVRTSVFISTDGEDNSSPAGATGKIKAIVQSLRSNEAWAGSFTINMLGVGNAANFRQSCINMGLDPDKCLVEVSTSAGDIRKQLGVVSQSVSSSSAGSTVNF